MTIPAGGSIIIVIEAASFISEFKTFWNLDDSTVVGWADGSGLGGNGGEHIRSHHFSYTLLPSR